MTLACYCYFFILYLFFFFFFSSRRRHTRWNCDWSSDVCSSDLRASRRRGTTCPDDLAQAMTDRLLGRTNTTPTVRVNSKERSEERRVGKECRSRGSPDH